MARTFITLASTTLGSDANYIEFSSISNAYTDLFISVTYIYAQTSNIDYPTMWVGTGGTIDTGSNYSGIHGEARTGAYDTYSYDNATNTTLPYGQALSNGQYCQANYWLLDYSATNKFKPILCDYYTVASLNIGGVGMAQWRNTGAIDKVRIGPSGGGSVGQVKAGSVATVWGVLKA